eukprot:TRINITY_DN9057_c0_g1_i1.p1 TRINITY_DN9057_c0_g1~~TRINITY_DN9057_c0_g1_i1.p1  ORF type:complete len:1142 (+),score=217.94 TRINITY_DN9057_c0_g1_i1:96-3521(+)
MSDQPNSSTAADADSSPNTRNLTRVLKTVRQYLQSHIDASPASPPQEFAQFMEIKTWTALTCHSTDQKELLDRLQATLDLCAKELVGRKAAVARLQQELAALQGASASSSSASSPLDKRASVNLDVLRGPTPQQTSEVKGVSFAEPSDTGLAPTKPIANSTASLRKNSIFQKATKTVPITHAVLCTNYTVTPKIAKTTPPTRINSQFLASIVEQVAFNPHTSTPSKIINIINRKDGLSLDIEIRPIYRMTDVNQGNATKVRLFVKGWDLAVLSEGGDVIAEVPLHACHISIPDPFKQTSFFVHTPKALLAFCTDTNEMRDEAVQYLVDITYEAKCLDRFDGISGVGNWKKSGHMLCFDRTAPLNSRVKYCIVTPGSIEIRSGPKDPLESEISLSSSSISECSIAHMKNTFTISSGGKIHDFTTLTRTDYLSWISEISALSKTFQSQISSGKWTGYATVGQKKLLASKKTYWLALEGGQLSCYTDSKALELARTYVVYGSNVQKEGTDKVVVTFDSQSSIVITMNNEAVLGTLLKALRTAASEAPDTSSTEIRRGYLFVAHEQDTALQKSGALFWFVLTHTHLSKYSGSKAHRPLISYDLKKLSIVDKEQSEPYLFTISYTQQTTKLFATDEKTAQAWVEDIKNASVDKPAPAVSSQLVETAKPSLGRYATSKAIGGIKTGSAKKRGPGPNPLQHMTSHGDLVDVAHVVDSDDDTPAESSKDGTNKNASKSKDSFAVRAFTTDDIFDESHDNDYLNSLGLSSNGQKSRIRKGAPREASPVIIDNGSAFTKIGFAHQDLPSTVFPSCVSSTKVGDSFFVSLGYEAQKQSKIGAQLAHPFDFGTDLDADSLADMYQYSYGNILNVDSANHPVVLTTPRNLKFEDLRVVFEMMFEGFEVPALIVRRPGLFPFHEIGVDSGMVVDIGTRTTITCMWDGHLLQQSTMTYPLGGRQVDAYAAKLLSEEAGYAAPTIDQGAVLHKFKSTLCSVSLDFQTDCTKYRAKGLERYLHIPGSSLKVPIRNQGFRVPEVLFQPSIAGYDAMSVPQMIAEAIKNCAVDLRPRIAQNIILSGGHTCFPGFGARLQEELKSIREMPKFKIIDRKNKKFLAWNGAAMLSKATDLQSIWLTADDYYEGNLEVVHTWGLA